LKDKKWLHIMGLALSLPSTIFAMAYGSMLLYEHGILTKMQSVFLFLAVIFNSLFMMVYYAYKKKN